MGAMIEPPNGEPAYPPLFEAIEELGLDVFAIVEHDMYLPTRPAAPHRRAHAPLHRRLRHPLAGDRPALTSSEQPT